MFGLEMLESGNYDMDAPQGRTDFLQRGGEKAAGV